MILASFFYCRGSPDKPDLSGFTSLHHACNADHMDVVSYLINFGCNVWSLDNDHNTALDIAALRGRTHIVKFLDEFQDRQLRINPSNVKKLKERSIEEAEKNIKKYERRQERSIKHAEKEERRRISQVDQEFKPPSKKNIFKTLTLKFKTAKTFQNQTTSRQYSDYTNVGAKKKHLMTDKSSMSEFRVSEFDDTGTRTHRSVQGTTKGNDVMYVPNGDGGSGSVDNTYSSPARPALTNVFPSARNSKWKSESDLIDSGIDDSINDEEDRTPGTFYRPGFGGLAFLRTGITGTFDGFNRANSLDYLNSYSDTADGTVDEVDGAARPVSKELNSDSIGSTSSLEERMDGVPWKKEVLDDIDDEDEESKYSDLVRFLDSIGLSNYTHKFTSEDTDLDALMLVNEGDLKELGLGLGPRKKLMDAINKRKQALSAKSVISDTFL